MSNSPLASVRKPSPNHSGKRLLKIDRITPHCVVGQLSADRICELFVPAERHASCNYAIGYDGKIGISVDEDNRSWCSSSSANDGRAVTIEVASDKTHPYAFKDAAYNALVELCVDICRRNGKTKLIWIADKNDALAYKPADHEMQLTVHRWFANKACPGDWLFSRMGQLAETVTAKLTDSAPKPKTIYRVQTGAFRVKQNALNQMTGLKASGFDAFVTAPVSGVYRVQVGAFSVRANAEKYAEKIKKAGFPVYITTAIL